MIYIIDIDGPGWPDGMCVDLDGNIWVAEWEGSRVRKWDIATGKVLNEITLPCSRVTSCCLGGDNMDELFITTAQK
jgi:sugar lactone lactonase YvrE